MDLGGLARRGRANRDARRPPPRADHCSCEWSASALRYLPGLACTSVEKPAAAQRVHHCDLLKGRSIDLRRQRELYSLQNHGLRRSVPRGLLLRGREHARHPPGPMHRLRGVRAGVPGRRDQADTEPGLEKWLSLNAEYAKIWPNITIKKAPPPNWKEWEGKSDKLQYFSQ